MVSTAGSAGCRLPNLKRFTRFYCHVFHATSLIFDDEGNWDS